MAHPKCKSCLTEEPDKSKLIKEKEGYFHIGECYEKFLSHKAFKEEESLKWDDLYKYVKQLHNIPDGIDIPTMPVARLQALRNGYDIIKGKREKKYKEGASYELLLAAYKLKEDDIKWFIHNVLQEQSDAPSISKCISIMLKSLSEAWRLEQNKKKNEATKDRLFTQTKTEDMSVGIKEVKMNKKKDEMDISDLL